MSVLFEGNPKEIKKEDSRVVILVSGGNGQAAWHFNGQKRKLEFFPSEGWSLPIYSSSVIFLRPLLFLNFRAFV